MNSKADMPTIDQARHWYPDLDPVHGFDHVLRVYRMAERLALAEGADIEIVHAAALLHDAEGSATAFWSFTTKRVTQFIHLPLVLK